MTGHAWVWSGRAGWIRAAVARAIGRQRSFPPETFAPLFDVPGVRFFSLQKEGARAPAHFPLTDVMNEMADFADTAALVENLDLVITIDTSVVHLAGALGRPVWLLDRFLPCWRWLHEEQTSPWYRRSSLSAAVSHRLEIGRRRRRPRSARFLRRPDRTFNGQSVSLLD